MIMPTHLQILAFTGSKAEEEEGQTRWKEEISVRVNGNLCKEQQISTPTSD